MRAAKGNVSNQRWDHSSASKFTGLLWSLRSLTGERREHGTEAVHG